MSFKKIILFLIVGLIAISAVNAGFFGSDTKEATVNGVNFVLDDSITVTGQQDNFTNFKVKNGITGYLASIVNNEDLESYLKNDTELGYKVFKVNSIGDIDEYGYIDEGIDKGYFILFEKDGKQFVYQINTELSAGDNDVREVADLMVKFTKDNKDLKPV